MNTQADRTNQPTEPIEGMATEPNANQKPRPVRAAVLLDTAATLGAAVLVVAMAGPKLPPYMGE